MMLVDLRKRLRRTSKNIHYWCISLHSLSLPQRPSFIKNTTIAEPSHPFQALANNAGRHYYWSWRNMRIQSFPWIFPQMGLASSRDRTIIRYAFGMQTPAPKSSRHFEGMKVLFVQLRSLLTALELSLALTTTRYGSGMQILVLKSSRPCEATRDVLLRLHSLLMGTWLSPPRWTRSEYGMQLQVLRSSMCKGMRMGSSLLRSLLTGLELSLDHCGTRLSVCGI